MFLLSGAVCCYVMCASDRRHLPCKMSMFLPGIFKLFKLFIADLIVAIAVGESVSMFSVQVRINVAVAVAVVHPSVPWTSLY